VGNRPWSYADALAKRICKVDKIIWVPGDQLHKVIAALRYQARREGWDLSGEIK
jgi:phage gp16-like protein